MAGKSVILSAAIAAAAIAASMAGASETIVYTYDAKGRLIKVTHTGTINNGIVANYSFDNADNRVNVNVSGVP